MKRLLILWMLTNLSLAPGCVVVTSDVGEIGTPLTADSTAVAATQMAQAPDALTPGLADTPTLRAKVQDKVREPSTATPTGAPAPAGASVTLDVDLNVRTGPGTNYERIGWLAAGTTVSIIGRNANYPLP
jgi:uncharacterized protein YgiM (DUF1202 family)